MAKKQAATKRTGKLTGQTIAFAGKFGYSKEFVETMRKQAEAEGATVMADPEKAAPDYLVAGAGVGGNPPAAWRRLP